MMKTIKIIYERRQVIMNYFISAGGFPAKQHMNLSGGIILKHDSYMNEERHCEEDMVMAIVVDELCNNANTAFISDMIYDVFSDWYEMALESVNDGLSPHIVADIWDKILNEVNEIIYTEMMNGKDEMGAAFTGMFIKGDKYMIMNVGINQVFYVKDECRALNEQQWTECTDEPDTEVSLSIGCCKELKPDVIFGYAEEGLYVISSSFDLNIGMEEEDEELAALYLKSEEGYDEVMRDLLQEVEQYIYEKEEVSNDNMVILIKAVNGMKEPEGYLS